MFDVVGTVNTMKKYDWVQMINNSNNLKQEEKIINICTSLNKEFK